METNVSRPKIYKRIEITPNDWMKIYEGRKGELVFRENPTHLSAGKNVSLVAYNFQTKKVLSGLPSLKRSIISIEVEIDPVLNKDYIVKLGEEI